MQQSFADTWDILDLVRPFQMILVKHINFYCLLIPDAQAFSNAFYGQGSGPLYLDNVQCSGSELDLFDCPGDTTPSCTQADAAGVRCNPTRKPVFQ